MREKGFIFNYDSFRIAVQKALSDEDFFNEFKRSSDFSTVVSTIGESYGRSYYQFIKAKYPYLLNYVDRFITGDKIGNPILYEFDGIKCDPLTFRYVKILGDLVKYFGKLDGMNIVEIGAGFGGQCKIIHDLYKPASYTIIDFPEVGQLAKKYLDVFNVPIILREMSDTSSISYDLCISNYAFSEITRQYQDFYYDYVVKNSTGGYMLLNFLTDHKPEKGFTRNEFCTMITPSKLYKENPRTGFDNALLLWRNNFKKK